MRKGSLFLLFMLAGTLLLAQNFNGVDMSLGTLSKLSNAKTRSISPENFTGAKGKGGMANPKTQKEERNMANAANIEFVAFIVDENGNSLNVRSAHAGEVQEFELL